jgi:hypothetical protein
MHFSTATKILAFTAIISTATARSTTKYRRQAADVCMVDSVTSSPSQADAKAAIDQWNIDVNTVNAFLNQASGLAHGMEIQNATMQTLLFAQDEPCQLNRAPRGASFLRPFMPLYFSNHCTNVPSSTPHLFPSALFA